MRRRPGFAALLLLLSAVASSDFLNLAFTLPLLLLGLALMAWSQVRWLQRYRWCRAPGLILGMTAVMTGLAMSLINLQRRGWISTHWSALLRPFSQQRVTKSEPINQGSVSAQSPNGGSVRPQPLKTSAPALPRVIDEGSRHVGDYGTPASEGAWVSGPEQSLGYRYRTGLKPLRSRLVGQDSGRVIYDVVYFFDPQGNRVSTPSPAAEEKPAALFLGGSFMFGEGLNDQDTLPSQFAQVSGLPAINAGMHGYGSHQAYRLLDDDTLYRQRTNQQPVQLVVYRVIGNHAIRASGRYPWDRFGPCYQVVSSGDLDYQGSFQACGRRWGLHNAASNILQTLENSREPFTRDLAETWERALTTERDRRRHLALIAGMQKKAGQHGAEFVVVNETLSPAKTPDPSGRYACSVDPSAVAVGQALRRMGIRVLDTHQVLSLKQCTNGSWIIPGDGHPSAAANRQLARALAELQRSHVN